MLGIRDSMVERTMFGLTVIFLAGLSQAMAQVKPSLNDKTLQPTATQPADPVQKQASAGTNLPQRCQPSADETQPSEAWPHNVKLSWNASVPLTTSTSDQIRCYLVYRSATPPDTDTIPIGITLAPETTYLDLHVKPGDYYYAVRAVNVGGETSDFSKNVPVQVPR